MNKEILYRDFREELDKYAIPLILDNSNSISLYTENNEFIGFVNIIGDYLDAFYILPEYRKKGYGSVLAKQIVKDYKIKRLHIINTNTPAINFWNKNFKLKEIESNFCDTLYEIEEK